MLIGERLKKLRKKMGLNQKQLGELIKVTKVSICCYEKGKREPGLSILASLADVLNTSTDYLLGRSEI
jgi:transcriptional regulator with XRE-family HTH domain